MAPTKVTPPKASTRSREPKPTATKEHSEEKNPEETPTEETSESQTPDHPAAQGIPLPPDPSAVQLQEEQDELQQPGRVARGLADQIDNEPGYSRDQLAHMAEYWSHGDAVGEDVTTEDDDE